MPAHIDPAWEYWEPDPEIAFAMHNGEVTGLDLIPKADLPSGRAVLDGFRRGTDPRKDATRLGPERPSRPDRLPLRRCLSCPMRFTPKDREHRYCSRACVPPSGPGRRLADRRCDHCGAEYRPTYDGQRACGRACAGRLSGLTRTGRKIGPSPLRGRPNPNAGMRPVLDWGRFAELHADGLSARQIAGRCGVSRATVRNALRRLGVFRPAKGGRRRVVPDATCRACGVAFRPLKSRAGPYCSRPCFDAHCKRTPLDPAKVLAMHAAGRNHSEIARELGGSESGVRGVISRAKKKGTTPQRATA